MNIPTKEELRALSQTNREVAVSIFMPTHEAGPQTRENHIRFKNRLQEAGALPSERGYDAKDIDGLLDSAQALVGEADFWQHQRKGLALFITPEESFEYRLPVASEKPTFVPDRFHLKLLMPLPTGNGRFYILAMNLNSLRLLKATRYSVSKVPLRAYAAAGARSGGGDRLQAQGAGEPDRKENIRRFFTAFDNGLRKMLEPQGDRIPVVFAGNVSNFPIYREANHYNGLMDEFVEGNPEEMNDETLHLRPCTSAPGRSSHLTLRRGKDAEAFRVKAGSSPAHASADLHNILPAAYDSRVQTLFVPLGQHR